MGAKSRSPTKSTAARKRAGRSEEHTSELQSRLHLVCRLLLEKKKKDICGTPGLPQRTGRFLHSSTWSVPFRLLGRLVCIAMAPGHASVHVQSSRTACPCPPAF